MDVRETIQVRCKRCQGRGLLDMSGKYADTYAMLRKQRRELNGAQLAKIAGIEPTAMNNRLAWLEGAGLANGRWNNRERLWKAL